MCVATPDFGLSGRYATGCGLAAADVEAGDAASNAAGCLSKVRLGEDFARSSCRVFRFRHIE